MLFFFQDSGEKTEEPTPHRLREARRKGQVFKSMELNSAINILGVMLLFTIFGTLALGGIEEAFNLFAHDMLAFSLNMENAHTVLWDAITRYFSIMAPVFAVAFILGITANLVQVGFLTSTQQMAPQLKRLNPLEGVKKIASKKALFEMVKSILKIGVISTVAVLFIYSRLDELLKLINQSAAVSLGVFWNTIIMMGLIVGLVFLFIALLDYIYQRYEHKQSLKMSQKEIKDEHKNLEGDPLIRSKLKEKQRKLAQERMMQDVPDADVVITNPTEIAVALVYREGQDQAPRVVAKGVEVLAQKIREIAGEHEVPVVENPPVAQILWKKTEIGEEIPIELYQAVAEIMAMVYRMREKRSYI